MKFFQLTLALLAFLCVLTLVVAHIVMGNIHTALGFIVAAFFIISTAKLVRLAWQEFNNEEE